MIHLHSIPRVKLSSTESLYMSKGGFKVLTKKNTWKRIEFLGKDDDLRFHPHIADAAQMIRLLIMFEEVEGFKDLYEAGKIRIIRTHNNSQCIAMTL